MYLVNILSEVVFTCKDEELPVVDGGIYRRILRIPLVTPIPRIHHPADRTTKEEGAPEAIISATGGRQTTWTTFCQTYTQEM